jgi:hypothetical protein
MMIRFILRIEAVSGNCLILGESERIYSSSATAVFDVSSGRVRIERLGAELRTATVPCGQF